MYFLLTGTVSILSFATSLFAAGVSVTGIGARATSLGGSFRAISDDWSGMYWNPAGITQINGWHIGFTTELLSPVGSYKPALWDDPTLGVTTLTKFSVTRQTDTKNEPQTSFAPCLGVVHTLSDNFTVGLGVWAPFGLGAKWDLLDTGSYNSNIPEYDYVNNIAILDIHPTVAYKLNDMLSIGAGIGLIYADVNIQQPIFSKNPYFGGKIGGYSKYRNQTVYENLVDPGIRDSLVAAGALVPDLSLLVAESELAVSGLGYGANLGVMVKVNDRLQIGVSGRYYGNVKLSGKLNATMYYDTSAQAQQILDNYWRRNPASPINRIDILEAAYNKGDIKEYQKNALLNAYSGGTSVFYDNAKATLTIPLPGDAGIGIAYKVINENDRHLLLSSDFQIAFNSVWKVFNVDINDGEDAFQYVQNWNNTYRASLGVEYKMNPVWMLRGAYFRETNAGIPETLTPTFPDINVRNSINAGFQFNVKPNIALHCNYERITFGNRDFGNWEYNLDNIAYDNMAGSYSLSVNNFMLGVEYNF